MRLCDKTTFDIKTFLFGNSKTISNLLRILICRRCVKGHTPHLDKEVLMKSKMKFV